MYENKTNSYLAFKVKNSQHTQPYITIYCIRQTKYESKYMYFCMNLSNQYGITTYI